MLVVPALLCVVAPPVAFGVYVLVSVPTPPSPLTALEFVGMEATIQCDAGELKRTEAAIKVSTSLSQGACGANPVFPDAPADVLAVASNPFECVAANGLWTPTGAVTMETLKAEGFFVDMGAIESFSDACTQAKVRTALTVFWRLYEAFGRPTYQWICCTVQPSLQTHLHFRCVDNAIALRVSDAMHCLTTTDFRLWASSL
jgi:hypothetical protein